METAPLPSPQSALVSSVALAKTTPTVPPRSALLMIRAGPPVWPPTMCASMMTSVFQAFATPPPGCARVLPRANRVVHSEILVPTDSTVQAHSSKPPVPTVQWSVKIAKPVRSALNSAPPVRAESA